MVQPELRQRKWTDPVEFDVKSELKSLLMPLDEVGYCGVFLFVFFFLKLCDWNRSEQDTCCFWADRHSSATQP